MNTDPYTVLGVDRNASPEQIKTAYRRLVKQYHPDFNKAPEAEAKFKEITEAYDILSDAHSRARYDQGGMFSTEPQINDIFGFPRWNNGKFPRKGNNIQFNVKLSLTDLLKPIQREFSISRTDVCDSCAGRGLKWGAQETKCPMCQGTGFISTGYRKAGIQVMQQTLCSGCKGEGIKIPDSDKCSKCNGQGVMAAEHKISVTIPAGIHDGMTLRIAEQGHVGKFGGPRGDVFVDVTIEPHPRFKRNDADIYYDLPVTFAQACFGDKVTYQGIDGNAVEIVIPQYCKSDTIYVSESRGLPQFPNGPRGNLITRIIVDVPQSLTEEQKQLLKRFADIERGKV